MITTGTVGCTSGSPNTSGDVAEERDTPTATDTASTLSDADFEELFRVALESQTRITIQYLSTDSSGVVFLEYVPGGASEQELAREIGSIAGGWAGAIDQGWQAELLEVTILGRNGVPIGDFYIKASWARALNSNEITMEEYLQLVLDTLNVYD